MSPELGFEDAGGPPLPSHVARLRVTGPEDLITADREPRSAIALGDGELLTIVVEGRAPHESGMLLHEPTTSAVVFEHAEGPAC